MLWLFCRLRVETPLAREGGWVRVLVSLRLWVLREEWWVCIVGCSRGFLTD